MPDKHGWYWSAENCKMLLWWMLVLKLPQRGSYGWYWSDIGFPGRSEADWWSRKAVEPSYHILQHVHNEHLPKNINHSWFWFVPYPDRFRISGPTSVSQSVWGRSWTRYRILTQVLGLALHGLQLQQLLELLKLPSGLRWVAIGCDSSYCNLVYMGKVLTFDMTKKIR